MLNTRRMLPLFRSAVLATNVVKEARGSARRRRQGRLGRRARAVHEGDLCAPVLLGHRGRDEHLGVFRQLQLLRPLRPLHRQRQLRARRPLQPGRRPRRAGEAARLLAHLSEEQDPTCGAAA